MKKISLLWAVVPSRPAVGGVSSSAAVPTANCLRPYRPVEKTGPGFFNCRLAQEFLVNLMKSLAIFHVRRILPAHPWAVQPVL
jgi:hypothetical protein